MQFGGNPGSAAKALRQPRRGSEVLFGNPQHQRAAADQAFQVAARERIAPFRAAASSGGNQGRDASVRAPVGGEQDELQIFLDPDLGTEDEAQAACLRLLVRAHRAGERALVGQGERLVAERMRARHQLLGVRCAAQEAEVRKAVQLGVIRQKGHADTSHLPLGRPRRARHSVAGRRSNRVSRRRRPTIRTRCARDRQAA